MNDKQSNTTAGKRAGWPLWKKLLLLLTLSTVLLVVLALAIALLFLSRHQAMLEKEVAVAEREWKEAGFPLTAQDLAAAYPEVPSEENAAVALQAAFDVFEQADPGGALFEELGQRFDGVDFEGMDIRADVSEEDWQAAAAYVSRMEHIFPIVEDALRKPQCHFPVDLTRILWQEGSVAYVEVSHHKPLTQLARVFSVASRLAAKKGDTAKAVHHLGTFLRLASLPFQDPVFASHILRVSLLGIGTRTAIRPLQSGARLERTRVGSN